MFTKKGMFDSKSVTVRAADDISFSLKKGEVFVLAGESGSGKSTIAKLILRDQLSRILGKFFLRIRKFPMTQRACRKLE